jgi:hypothetical protein
MNSRTYILNLCFLVLVCFTSKAVAKEYFVKQGASGLGNSWESSFGDLQKALTRSKSGDIIYVAQGIYYPTAGTNRSTSFVVPKGVKLLGGYEGSNISHPTQDFKKHTTILSGNIGTDDANDNSFNVILILAADSTTLLQGFVIQDGRADGIRSHHNRRNNSGGGLVNEGRGNRASSPIITHCVFRSNYAEDGGAVYNSGREGDASATFLFCSFEYNIAIMDGGAVYNNGSSKGIANVVFRDCYFIGNTGNYGGAMMNYSVGGVSQTVLDSCVFTANKAYMKGGAVSFISSDAIQSDRFASNRFVDNSALDLEANDIHYFQVIE